MSRKFLGVVAAFVGLSVLAGPAISQEGRFRLERTDRGLVRMDSQTGVMELCVESSAGLDCKPALTGPASTATREIDALRARIDQLEKRIVALEEGTGAGAKSLPSDEEFERTLGFMERFMRRFIGIAKDLESDQKPSTPTPTPNRT